MTPLRRGCSQLGINRRALTRRRQAFLLSNFEDLSVDAITAVTGVTPAVAKARVRNAADALARDGRGLEC